MVSEWVQYIMAGKAWQQVWVPNLTDRKQIDPLIHVVTEAKKRTGSWSPNDLLSPASFHPQKIQLS